MSFVPPAYTPPEFFSPPDDCPVCPARAGMEEAFEKHGQDLEAYSSSLDALPFSCNLDKDVFLAANRSLRQYDRSFVAMVMAYRNSDVLNLAIYYTIEVKGHLSDSSEALLAYEGYRAEAGRTVDNMKAAFQRLKQASKLLNAAAESAAAEAFARLLRTHNLLNRRIKSFWKALGVYTEERKSECFRLD